MGEHDPTLTVEEIWNLLAEVEAVNPPDDDPSCPGERTFELANGWKAVLFYDCTELDYIDSFIDPSGKKIDPWDWIGSIELNILRCWRGVGDLARLKDVPLDEF